MRRTLTGLAMLVLSGCLPIAAPGDGGNDASLPDTGPLPPADQLDLLFLIDNSCSMSEEQASIITEIPRIITVLSTGHDASGAIPERAPIPSIHVGIVSTDMGLGDVTGIATCDPGLGDDGIMEMRSRRGGTGCMADYRTSYGDVFAFEAGAAISAVQFGTDVGCVASIGTDGCGFEFPLEAPLKAISLAPTASGLSPVSWTRAGYHPPSFWGGTTGHGSDPATNGAFLRPDSVLAVVLVTDEEDCSTPVYEIFSPDDPAHNVDASGNPVNLDLRCHTWGSELYPVSRYVDGFLGLRRHPSRLVFAAITGVPAEVAGCDTAEILGHPAMQEQINPDPAHRDTLLPSCVSPGMRGVAYPPRRITEVAGALQDQGAHATMQSICNTDFSAAFTEIIGLIGQAAQ